MRTTSATEFQKCVGEFSDIARREPVTVTRHGRPSLVLLSAEDYHRLKQIEERNTKVMKTTELPEETMTAMMNADVSTCRSTSERWRRSKRPKLARSSIINSFGPKSMKPDTLKDARLVRVSSSRSNETPPDAPPRVTVLPITSQQPRASQRAIEIPNDIKPRIGLDRRRRAWLVIDEANVFK